MIVDGRCKLDAAAIGGADHADPRIERVGIVELDLRLRRHPADDRRDVLALEVRIVYLQRAARTPLTTRVPGDDVVPGLSQCADADDVVRQQWVIDRIQTRLAR